MQMRLQAFLKAKKKLNRLRLEAIRYAYAERNVYTFCNGLTLLGEKIDPSQVLEYTVEHGYHPN